MVSSMKQFSIIIYLMYQPGKSETGDNEGFLTVNISDALSEVDKVKFTVHTKVIKARLATAFEWLFQTNLSSFPKTEISVVRQHEEFLWLHDRIQENEDYAGYIVSLMVFLFCGLLLNLSIANVYNDSF